MKPVALAKKIEALARIERAGLDELLAMARAEFGEVGFEKASAGGETLEILQIQDMPAYLDRLAAQTAPGTIVELPFWAKVWPACLVLASFLARLPLPAGAVQLEIGAGAGLCGLMTAKCGAHVVISDADPHALLFARAAILKNGLADRASTVLADFTRDRLGRRFDRIVGCETFYRDMDYGPVVDFLLAHLAPGPDSEVVLCQDKGRKGLSFFAKARERFRVLMKEIPYSGEGPGEKSSVVLYRLGVL